VNFAGTVDHSAGAAEFKETVLLNSDDQERERERGGLGLGLGLGWSVPSRRLDACRLNQEAHSTEMVSQIGSILLYNMPSEW
jgi:hypothetical protein